MSSQQGEMRPKNNIHNDKSLTELYKLHAYAYLSVWDLKPDILLCSVSSGKQVCLVELRFTPSVFSSLVFVCCVSLYQMGTKKLTNQHKDYFFHV